ncbi:MAG TPA: aldehyde dehydrogenase family protein [Anaerolineales bacterium]|nr:aldehyde dehydrogenase family protein [Anaerolineales bacterium]
MHFLAGQPTPPTNGRFFEVYSPDTGKLLGYAARGDASDADLAVRSARRAFAQWSALPPGERERVMLTAADLIEANAHCFQDLIIDESGSTIRKARFEISYSASLLRAAAGEARRLYGETFPNDKPQRISMVLREPLGVVVAISPFNAPLVLLVKMICFALAAGNAVIAKPSEETPLVALELARILALAGFPAGTFQVVNGFGAEVGAALVNHPHINGIAFTGSTASGVRIAQQAVTHMHRMQMELGGKNPLLVLKDIDPVQAANVAAVGAFFHGGQICMSSARIIAEREVARPFAEALAQKATRLYLGDLRDEQTAYGPLINQRAIEKVQAHVDDALQGGAELLCGGKLHHGNVYAPTVLWEPSRRSAAWCSETFGPVVSVVAVDDLDAAIALANESEYGLSAGILTNDLQRGLSAARRIRCGAVHVGTHSYQSDTMAPVGGFGMSGFGRSGGKYSVEHFTELKWVSIELGETPNPF